MNMDGVPAAAMYRELILEEYKHPKNKGKLEGATHSCHVRNPLCGDEITVTIKVEENQLHDLKFEGHGCAISQSAASLFTEHIKGMALSEIRTMDEEEIIELLGFTPNPMRMKCAVLVLRAVDGALKGDTRC